MNDLEKEYFEWMYDSMGGQRYSKDHSFRKLFAALHSTEFVYSIEKDANRADDGVNLRTRFALARGYDEEDVKDILSGPCSVLEMMIALAIRCEENIMDNPEFGDRTNQWFWNMIVNLGLGAAYDSRFNKDIFDGIMKRFLERKYERDGTGGLFKIRKCKLDVRKLEIWQQLSLYLSKII